MKLAEFALNNRVTTLVLTFVVLIAGYFSFNSLARYEDPEFTIKDAVVVTRYPGASPEEVERIVGEIGVFFERFFDAKRLVRRPVPDYFADR